MRSRFTYLATAAVALAGALAIPFAANLKQVDVMHEIAIGANRKLAGKDEPVQPAPAQQARPASATKREPYKPQ